MTIKIYGVGKQRTGDKHLNETGEKDEFIFS